MDPDARAPARGRSRPARGAAPRRHARGRTGARRRRRRRGGAGSASSASACRRRCGNCPTSSARRSSSRTTAASRSRSSQSGSGSRRHDQEPNVHGALAPAGAPRRTRNGDDVDVHELTAAYALDALDAESATRTRRTRAVRAMPRGARGARARPRPRSPGRSRRPRRPPALRARILAAAAAERENVDPAAGSAPLGRARDGRRRGGRCLRGGRRRRLGNGALAFARLGALGPRRRGARRADRDGPASTKVALRGGDGMLAVDQTGRGRPRRPPARAGARRARPTRPG